MDIYSYYDKIVESFLEGLTVDCIEHYEDKVIIRHTPEVDRKYFGTNISHIKDGVKELQFDSQEIHTTVIAKKNDKVIISNIFNIIKTKKCGTPYYKRETSFISFSKVGITTNENYYKYIIRVPYIRSFYGNYEAIQRKYNFFIRDIVKKYHPDMLWAIDLNKKYDMYYDGVKNFKKLFKCKEDYASKEKLELVEKYNMSDLPF